MGTKTLLHVDIRVLIPIQNIFCMEIFNISVLKTFERHIDFHRSCSKTLSELYLSFERSQAFSECSAMDGTEWQLKTHWIPCPFHPLLMSNKFWLRNARFSADFTGNPFSGPLGSLIWKSEAVSFLVLQKLQIYIISFNTFGKSFRVETLWPNKTLFETYFPVLFAFLGPRNYFEGLFFPWSFFQMTNWLSTTARTILIKFCMFLLRPIGHPVIPILCQS